MDVTRSKRTFKFICWGLVVVFSFDLLLLGKRNVQKSRILYVKFDEET